MKTFLKSLIVIVIATFVVVLVVYAATTIGTNISTNGTLSVQADSASALKIDRVDNSTVFSVDTVGMPPYFNGSVGINDSIFVIQSAEGDIPSMYFIRPGAQSDNDFTGAINFSGPTVSDTVVTLLAQINDATGSRDTSFHIINVINGATGFNYSFGSTFTSERGMVIDVSDSEALLVRKDGDSGDVFKVDTSTEITTLSGDLVSTDTGDIGWSVVSTTNTACTSVCTYACVYGQDSGDTKNIVPCSGGAAATADTCVCAGGS